MLRRLFRQAIVIITLGAFLGAGVMQIMPTAEAAAPVMTMKMGPDSKSAPTPCKNTTPGCSSDMGCIFMVGVPAMTETLAVTNLKWSRVKYWGSPSPTGGRVPEPAIGPPISIN